ncbi:phage major capsid protein [Pleomorphomonas sp. PLEO]|uniref:phage major capsid protein n=1 Tax=Pleomorphomonas sp. PLEO TaxID=3239306 RepID=UPI00351EF653
MIKKLRARIKELGEGLKALTTKEALELEDLKKVGEINTEIKEIEAQIKTLEEAEQTLVRTSSAPADQSIEQPNQQPAVVKDRHDFKAKIGLLAIATAMGANGKSDPLEVLRKGGYGGLADEFSASTARQKALNASSAVGGGILIPENMSEEIIEFLRPQTAFLRGNPRPVPMPNGTFTQAGGATGASASYGTELSNAAATEETFRDINMVAKELKALIPMSNQFLQFSIAGARAFVEADLRQALTETMDSNMFRGDGLQGRPLGLFNIPGIGSNAATNSTTPTVANIDSDLRKAINYLTTRNVSLQSAAWVIGRRTIGYMEDLRDGNGNFVFPTLQAANPTLKRIPVLDTTNLPENLGAGSNEGVIALIAFGNVLFGEASSLEFRASDQAAYYDAGGTMRSAFQRGETLILGLMQHDVALRHLPAVHTLTAVKYGG